MADLLATLTLGDFVSDAVVDHIDVTAQDANGAKLDAQVLPAGSTGPAVFTSVPAGDWTFTAQAVDASGAAIGPAATVEFTLAAPATVQIPVAIDVAQR